MAYEDYWIDRADERLADQQEYVTASILEINQAYEDAMKQLQKKIERLFRQYVREGGLTEQEARQLLRQTISTKEITDIWQQLETITDSEIRQQLLKQIDAYYYQSRITREEALQAVIQTQMSAIAQQELTLSTNAYTNVIKQEYLRSMFDAQQYLGIAFSFQELPEKVIRQILQENWSGKHYSKRIWGNVQNINREIEKLLLEGAMLGTNSRKLAKQLSDLAGSGTYAAERLIRTETTYFATMADLEAAKERGAKQIRFVATLDTRTSAACRAADGQIINIEDAKPGKNVPPLHPFCRSVIIEVPKKKGLVHKVRRARDPDTGENYLVPADMTYQEWQKNLDKGILLNEIGEIKYAVDEKLINSQLYEKKYETLTESERVNQSIMEHVREILKRRKGTSVEEVYLLDARDGKELFHIEGGKEEAIFPKGALNLLNSGNRDSIILVHNHPLDSSFSLADIDSISGVASIKGIVAAGHGGSVYYMDRPPYREDLKDIYQGLAGMLQNTKDRNHEIWTIIAKIMGVRYERR